MIYNISLVRCKRSNPVYKEIRDRHYVPNHGAVGQQLHYLILLDNKVVGIISGGAAAYAVKCRDDFFGITKENRHIALNGIVDNTVFRLEENKPNLATQVMALFRRTISVDWKVRYGVDVAGFETFVIETDTRKGCLYKADNWTFVGETQGSTKFHLHGIDKSFERISTGKKLVFCKWNKNGKLPTEYEATWNTNGWRGQMNIFDFIKEGE